MKMNVSSTTSIYVFVAVEQKCKMHRGEIRESQVVCIVNIVSPSIQLYIMPYFEFRYVNIVNLKDAKRTLMPTCQTHGFRHIPYSVQGRNFKIMLSRLCVCGACQCVCSFASVAVAITELYAEARCFCLSLSPQLGDFVECRS